MKIRLSLKIWLYSVSLSLYTSGVLLWVLERWFKVDAGFGLQSRASRSDFLHVHGILSLIFFVIFGCLYETHLKKGLKARRKLKSGFFLLLPLLIVMVTVPGLYYLNDGSSKSLVTWLHTYIGLALVLPAILHPLIKVKPKVHHNT